MRKQDREYNCGIFSALHILNFKHNPRKLEKIAKTTPSKGTSHKGIIKIFKYFGIETIHGRGSIKMLKDNHYLPAIVNYQYDGDGHYGVIISIGDEWLSIYNPGNGKLEIIKIKDFNKKWYSKRYGNKWFLCILEQGKDGNFLMKNAKKDKKDKKKVKKAY